MRINNKLGYLFLLLFWIVACKKDVNPDTDPIEEDTEQGLVTLSDDFLYWDEETTLTFDLAKGNKELANYADDLYLHAGLILTGSTSQNDWKKVVTEWEENHESYKLTSKDKGRYSITIHPATFFDHPNASDVTHIAFLVRNADGSKVLRNGDGSDMYWSVTSKQKPDVMFQTPTVQPTFIFQAEKQSFAIGEELPIRVKASQSGKLTLSVNGEQAASGQGDELQYKLTLNQRGKQQIQARIEANGQHSTRELEVFVEGDVETAELPTGIRKNGVTIDMEKREVSFALTAPEKSSAFLLGDFNDFQAVGEYAMKRTPDGKTWWTTLTGLDFQKKYTYQFLIDGQLKIADPYSALVLDPDHDGGITSSPPAPYPTGKTDGIVSVLALHDTPYAWKTASFVRPDIDDLVIYELHVRDFLDQRNYTTLRDSITYLKRLGVNAVELMPVQEFEGNSSWGYNPSFHFAVDKYYGTANELKAFIDECHQEGIAVLLDMVLNHAYGQSPMVRLYAEQSDSPLNSPWFNSIPTHPFNVGYDFNHESPLTQQYTKDVIAFWMDEFKLDGFRFDLSKGFTQKNSGTDESDGTVQQWSAYDAGRIAIWKIYNDFIRQQDQDFYVILEHFAEDREERELAGEGMYLWNNLNHVFNEATMGYIDNANLERLFADAHGFENPRFVSYMESHDEERLMYKNLMYGNTNGLYSTKEMETALERMKQAAVFLFCAPGPKMVWQFGELGYDVSIDENGRTGEKPLKWNYLQDSKRKALFNHYARLIRWKRQNTIFRNGTVDHHVADAVKYYVVQEAGQEVLILGNFDVESHDFTLPANLQKSWWDNIAGTAQDWRSTGSINLAPGQYYLLSINKLNN